MLLYTGSVYKGSIPASAGEPPSTHHTVRRSRVHPRERGGARGKGTTGERPMLRSDEMNALYSGDPRAPLGVAGWRWVVLIGGVSAVLVWSIRRAVPESPRWLIARNRLDDAEQVTAAMERAVEADLHTSLPVPPVPNITMDTPAQAAPGVRRIFSSAYRSRTVMLMVFNAAQTIGYYGFASWVPTLLIARGITTTTSLAYSFAIALAAPVGPLIVSRFADRLDRRWQIALSAAAIALVGLAFAQASGVALILLGVLLTCSNNWMSVAFHAYQAELFPTDIRAQAVGFVYSWSRFSAIFTSLVIGVLLTRFGVTGVFVFIAAAMAVAGGSVGIFGPRTSGLALEHIAS
mgnify:CR=1 FL=1